MTVPDSRIAGPLIALALTALLACSGSGGAAVPRSGDASLRSALALMLPRAEEAGRLALNGRGSPARIQAQYDSARDLEEALRAAGPVSAGCSRLLAAAQGFARAEIEQAEGVDRPSPVLLAAGVGGAAVASRKLARLPRSCSGGTVVEAAPTPPELDRPRSSEAFTGRASATAPPGTDAVDVAVGGAVVAKATLAGGTARIDLSGTYRRRSLEFRFRAGEELLGTARSLGTWLLPRSAGQHAAPSRRDAVLTRKLARLVSSFDGSAGIWFHDLSTGRAAGWNEEALFPAASTVKLAVLIAALERFGPRPERSAAAYDLRALSAWSSNLAANRLVRLLGRGSSAAGGRIAQALLSRLGAASSTYTGDYVIGTDLVPVAGVNRARGSYSVSPPLVSRRVTTARDLGRILYVLDAAAMNDRPALHRTGLSLHEARLGLALLLASEPRGDNLGLLRPAAGPALPIAQKNGWLRDARHTAAILYPKRGPFIVVLLTYRPGITRAEAAALGAKVLRLLLPPLEAGA